LLQLPTVAVRQHRTFAAPGASSSAESKAAVFVLALLYGLLVAPAVHANPVDSQPNQRIDSLCHPWGVLPCLVRVGASLRSAASGDPLAGKHLHFVAGTRPLCSATTDASGRATCLAVAPSGQSLAATGYRAVFDGDDRYWSENAVVKASARTTVSPTDRGGR